MTVAAAEHHRGGAPREREIVRGAAPVVERRLRHVAERELAAHALVDQRDRHRERLFIARQHRLALVELEVRDHAGIEIDARVDRAIGRVVVRDDAREPVTGHPVRRLDDERLGADHAIAADLGHRARPARSSVSVRSASATSPGVSGSNSAGSAATTSGAGARTFRGLSRCCFAALGFGFLADLAAFTAAFDGAMARTIHTLDRRSGLGRFRKHDANPPRASPVRRRVLLGVRRPGRGSDRSPARGSRSMSRPRRSARRTTSRSSARTARRCRRTRSRIGSTSRAPRASATRSASRTRPRTASKRWCRSMVSTRSMAKRVTSASAATSCRAYGDVRIEGFRTSLAGRRDVPVLVGRRLVRRPEGQGAQRRRDRGRDLRRRARRASSRSSIADAVDRRLQLRATTSTRVDPSAAAVRHRSATAIASRRPTARPRSDKAHPSEPKKAPAPPPTTSSAPGRARWRRCARGIAPDAAAPRIDRRRCR